MEKCINQNNSTSQASYRQVKKQHPVHSKRTWCKRDTYLKKTWVRVSI